MGKVTFLFVALFLITGILFAQHQTVSVAVIPFYDSDSGSSDSGRSRSAVSDLTNVLHRYRFIKLVERAGMDKLVGEIGLGMTGIIDESTAAKAGKAHGVQVMILGSIGGGRISARAVHVETNRVIAAASIDGISMTDPLGEKLAADIETYLAKENLKRLRNDSPDISLEFWAERIDRSGRKTNMMSDDKKGLRIGEKVVFHFKSNKTGYVTIVDIQPGGDVVVLFPNDLHPVNKITAGRMYSIPSEDDGFEITVSEPAGVDTLVAFFTTNSVDWLDPRKLSRDGFWTVKRDEKLALSRGFSITATKLKNAEWESRTLEMRIEK